MRSKAQQSFVDEVLVAARATIHAHLACNWFVPWMTAICCLESGWGKTRKGLLGENIAAIKWSRNRPESEQIRYGDGRVFRKFATIEDCLESLFYLIRKSRNYDQPRGIYLSDTSLENAQEDFIAAFSKIYCGGDPDHGEKVFSIYLKLVEGDENVQKNC